MKIPPLSAARLKKYRKLLKRKYREEYGLVLVEGVSIINELVERGRGVEAVIVDGSRMDSEGAAAFAEPASSKGVDLFLLDRKDFSTITSTKNPPAALAVAEMPRWTIENIFERNGPVVVLDRVSDPGNVGAILRTAAGFDAAGVILTLHSCDIYNPKVIRGSMGAIFNIPSVSGGDLAEISGLIRGSGYKIYGTVPSGGMDYREIRFAPRTALYLGSEAAGISGTDYDELISIPLEGGVESLNVSVALGVILSRYRA